MGSETAYEVKQPVPPRSWWGRLSGRVKLTIIAVVALVVIGLAVGLGVGLTVGNDGGDEDSQPSNIPTVTPSNTPKNLWQPAVNASWQIILLNPIQLASDATSVSPDVSVYDIDMYTNSQQIISTLHKLGKKVICYFSAGSYEPNRPDSKEFQSSDQGKELDGWPGEKWLNLKSDNVRRIMRKRIEYASSKGCDAIDPDNVDAYNNDNGLDLTQNDSIDFMNFLSSVAAPLNLSIGLKNAGDIVSKVLPIIQFSVNEQCVQYGECEDFAPFVQANKPVFHIEYPKDSPHIEAQIRSDMCTHSGKGAGSQNFSTVLKNMNLDGFVEYCGGATSTTPLNTTSSSS